MAPYSVFLSPIVCNCGGGPCDSVTGECLEEGFEVPTGKNCPTIRKSSRTLMTNQFL